MFYESTAIDPEQSYKDASSQDGGGGFNDRPARRKKVGIIGEKTRYERENPISSNVLAFPQSRRLLHGSRKKISNLRLDLPARRHFPSLVLSSSLSPSRTLLSGREGESRAPLA